MPHRPTGLPTDFAEAVLDLVAQVPPGTVLTYGDVAELLGTGGPRAVGTVLARFGSDVPWWRVIRAGGLPPRGHEDDAVARWLVEGTPLRRGLPGQERVDLGRARWIPHPALLSPSPLRAWAPGAGAWAPDGSDPR